MSLKLKCRLANFNVLLADYPVSSNHGIVVYVSPDRVDCPDDHHLVSGVRHTSVDVTEAGLGWIEPSFSDKSIRLAFMRKVKWQHLILFLILFLFYHFMKLKNYLL